MYKFFFFFDLEIWKIYIMLPFPIPTIDQMGKGLGETNSVMYIDLFVIFWFLT